MNHTSSEHSKAAVSAPTYVLRLQPRRTLPTVFSLATGRRRKCCRLRVLMAGVWGLLILLLNIPAAAQFDNTNSFYNGGGQREYSGLRDSALPYDSLTHANPAPDAFNPAGTFHQPDNSLSMEAAVSRNLPAAGTGYVSPFGIQEEPVGDAGAFGGAHVISPPENAVSPDHTPAAGHPTPTPLSAVDNTPASPARSTRIASGEYTPADYTPADYYAAPETPGDLIGSIHQENPGSREMLQPANDVNLPVDNVPMTPLRSQPVGYVAAEELSGGRAIDEADLPRTMGEVSDMGHPAPATATFQPLDMARTTTKGFEYEGKLVTDVLIVGNKRNKHEKIMQYILTRKGRAFCTDTLEEDVRRMNRSRMFLEIQPMLKADGDGVKVIYQVTELRTMRYLKFQGNEAIRVATLEKECGLKVDKPATHYDVQEARKKLEMFYHMKGYAKCVVRIAQGEKPDDPGVIFQIHEGPKFRIWSTKFIGNKVTTSARLSTVIQSKPGVFWVFQGELMDEIVTSDVKKLEDYYRRLGFFNARIGRRVKRLNEDGWSEVTFVINEGPQYKIRNIKCLGNDNVAAEILKKDMKIFEGKPFNKDRLDQSLAKVRRRYGREGYVFADINAETRFLEEPGELDIVFRIQEGKVYRVGRINVLIEGEFPQTQVHTVLNRLSVKPGDKVDVAELKHSERRLGASQLFEMSPAEGKSPKIVYSPPELLENQQIAKQVGLSVRDPNAGHVNAPTRNNESSPSAGARALGGAGAAAVQGGHSHKTLKMTVLQPPADMRLAENESLLDITIYGTSASAPPPAGHVAQANASVIRDPQTGECYRTFVMDDAEVLDEDIHLQGRVSVANDDPAYASTPIPTRASQRKEYTAHYLSNESEPVILQQIPVAEEAPVSQHTASWTAVDEYPAGGGIARKSTPDTVVRGNNPTLNDPGWMYPAEPSTTASTTPTNRQFSTTAPTRQTADSARHVGLTPPPQPGIRNTDTTPFTQPVGDAPPPGYSFGDWTRHSLPLTIEASETMTGRMMFQLGISSDAGLVGSIVLDEQNFDAFRWPKAWSEMGDGTAFRGAGQRFRIELQPGTELQRYSVSFDEPYLFNSYIGLGTSAMYYDRYYRNWTETRIGGQISFSHALTHDLRAYVGFRGYNIKMFDLSQPASQRMIDGSGSSGLYGFSARIVLDRRDNYAFATEGYYFSAELEQVIGTWNYPRANVQFKKYWLLAERADMSGRHVLSLTSTFAWTGDNTPIYESYFAGGSSSIRGFRFRDASPRENNMAVGGNFMVLASAEYLFPITADDTIRGVVFCDTGTVEQRIDTWQDRYRVSVGFGLRITMPMLGPAPIALDFAIPLSKNPGDVKEVFSITMGLQR